VVSDVLKIVAAAGSFGFVATVALDQTVGTVYLVLWWLLLLMMMFDESEEQMSGSMRRLLLPV
jgi:hypothetical protein